MRHSFVPCTKSTTSLATSMRTRTRAQASISSFVTVVSFVERPAANSDAFGLALKGTLEAGRAFHKGELVRAVHASTFVFLQPVQQPVQPFDLTKGPALIETELQREFPLFARVEGPHIVPTELMRYAKTYRQAVRLCLILARHRRPGIRIADIAAECALTRQHVTDYFHEDDKPQRRSLPADSVRLVEAFLGNSAISQWHADAAKFTVLEVLQARRAA